MKEKNIAQVFFERLNRSEDIEFDVKQKVKDSDFVHSGIHELWAGLIKHQKYELFNWLIENKIYPNEKSKIIEQLIFYYDIADFYKRVNPNTANDVKKLTELVLPVLEQTELGRESIIKDIERYFKYYGQVIVNESSYEFIEGIYEKYGDINKLYYLECVNQLKFYNTFSKPIFELNVIEENTQPILEKIIDTKYWKQIKKITFTSPINQSAWENYCEKFQEIKKLANKFPETNKKSKPLKI